MSNSIDGFRELIKTYEGDKLPWVHVHLDDGKELLAHIERLEAKVKRFEQAGIRWRKEQVEETFDQWIEDDLTHWISDQDAAWQAWMYIHEWKVYPMMKRIERLEANQIPEGHVAVPREPTIDMVESGAVHVVKGMDYERAKRAWRAMIQAATHVKGE